MPMSDTQKLDILWKKIGFGMSDSDTINKEGFNETIVSPLPVSPEYVIVEEDKIPRDIPPFADSGVLEYRTVQCTSDPTVADDKTWLPTEIFGDADTLIRRWIAPSYHPGYLVEVFDGDPDAGGSALNQGSIDEEWYFDYVSGVLHFPNNSPSGDIWIKGHVYVGQVGFTGSKLGNSITHEYATITQRDADTEVAKGMYALVDDDGSGEYALFVARADGPTSNWALVSTQDSANLDAKTLSTTLSFDSPTEIVLGNASQNSRVLSVVIDVDTPFDTVPTLSVGVDADNNALATDDYFDLTSPECFEVSSKFVFTNTQDTDVKVFFNPNGATAGSANIMVTFA